MATSTPPPIVLFLGPEEGEKQGAVQELRTVMQKHYGPGIEEYSYYAFETSPADVVAILRNGSLFGSAVVVRYRGVEALKRKEDTAILAEYAKHPSPAGLLIMESSEVGVHESLKKVAGAANTRIFWEMFENQKQGWLMSHFRRMDVRIEADAVELLLELVDNNTMDLRMEADRLVACVGNEITYEDVDQYVYHAREESVFTLSDAVLSRDLEHSLDILSKLIVLTDPVQILLGLSWQFERLHHLQLLRSSGVAEKDLFPEMLRAGFKVSGKRQQRGLLEASKRYSLESCNGIRILTGDTDALLRTVPAALHRGILEQYLYSVICRNGQWRPGRQEMQQQLFSWPGDTKIPF